ncbi:hypothetical protein [Paenibacillus sp. FSL P4-0288]|uniref:hypothetical protein n=1 Tax=Paenibacillus sp. FSL P4-0288 TaxID=2921633 RepID=UPI0030F6255E
MNLKFVLDAIGVLSAFNLFVMLVLHPTLAWINRKGFWETVYDNIFGSLFMMIGSQLSIVGLVGSLMIHFGVMRI